MGHAVAEYTNDVELRFAFIDEASGKASEVEGKVVRGLTEVDAAVAKTNQGFEKLKKTSDDAAKGLNATGVSFNKALQLVIKMADGTAFKINSLGTAFKFLGGIVSGIKDGFKEAVAPGGMLRNAIANIRAEMANASGIGAFFDRTINSIGNTIAKVRVGFASAKGFVQGLGDSFKDFGGIGPVIGALFTGIHGRIDQLGGKFTQFGQKIGALGMQMTIAAAAFTAGTTAMMRHTIDTAEAMGTMAVRTGIATETLSVYALAGEKANVPLQVLARSMQYLSNSMEKAKKPTSMAAKTFRDMGIDIKDSNGAYKKNTELILDVADAYSKMGDEQKKQQSLAKIFGTRMAQYLAPFFELGPKGLREAADATKKMGAIYTKEFTQAASAFKSIFAEVKAGTTGIKIAIMTVLMPAAQAAIERIRDLIIMVIRWIKEHPEFVKSFGKIAIAVTTFTAVVGPLLMAIKAISLGIGALLPMLKAIISPVGLIITLLLSWTAANPDLIDKTGKLKSELEGLPKIAQIIVVAFRLVLDIIYLVSTSFSGLKMIFHALVAGILAGAALIVKGFELVVDATAKVVKFLAKVSPIGKQMLKNMGDAVQDTADFLQRTTDSLNKGAADHIKIIEKESDVNNKRLQEYRKLESAFAGALKVLFGKKEAQKKENEEIEKNTKLLRQQVNGYMAVNDEMKVTAETTGLIWKADISDRIQEVDFALAENYTRTQATEESLRAMMATQTKNKMLLGEVLNAEQAWSLSLTRGVKTIDDNKKAAGYLRAEFDELTKRYKAGKVDQAEYAKGTMAIADAAKETAPELAALAREAGRGWERAGQELDNYWNKLIELAQGIRAKQQEFDNFNRNLATGIKDDIESKGDALSDFIRKTSEEIDKFYKKPPTTAVGMVSEGEQERFEEQTRAIFDQQKAYEDMYTNRVKQLNKYYDEEKRKFNEEVIPRYTREAELINNLNELRIRSAQARNDQERAAAMANYTQQETLISEKYNKMIEDSRTAGLERLKQERITYILPAIMQLENLRKKAVKLHEDRQKRLIEIEKQLPGKSAEFYQQMLDNQEAYKNRSIDMWTEIAGVISGVLTNVTDIFHQKAENLRATITDEMDSAQVAAIEAKINIADAWGNLWGALGQGLSNFAANFKKLKDQGVGTASAIAEAFGAQMAGQLGSALGGLIGGGGSKTYGSLGASLGGTIGSIILPGIGSVIGSLVGGLFGGLFKKKKTAEEKAAEELKKQVDAAKKSFKDFGKITDETAKKIVDLTKKYGRATATIMSLTDVMEDAGITTKNFQKYIDAMNKSLTGIRNGSIEAIKGLDAVGAAFEKLLEWSYRMDREGSKEIIAFLQNVRKSGLEVQQVNDYVYSQLGSAIEGLTKMTTSFGGASYDELVKQKTLMTELADEVDKLSKSRLDTREAQRDYIRKMNQLELLKESYAALQSTVAEEVRPELERLSTLTMATFNSLIAQGMSLTEVFTNMSEPLTALKEKYDTLGISGSAAIQELFKIMDVSAANKELMNAIDGNRQVLEALGNTGFLDMETFKASAEDAADYYKKLTEAGLTSKQALALISPTLADLDWYAKQYGLTVDEATQALIDQAKAAGVFKERGAPIADLVKSGFEGVISRLDLINDALRGRANQAQYYTQGYPENGAYGPSTPVIEAQTGFTGTVTGPKMFYIEPGVTEKVNITKPAETEAPQVTVIEKKYELGNIVLPWKDMEAWIIKLVEKAVSDERLVLRPRGISGRS